MHFRAYDPDRDLQAARRIWREVGWLPKDQPQVVDCTVGCGRALVAEVDGEVECVVSSAPGVLRYLAEDLPSVEYTSVATGRAARRLGLATRTMARVMVGDVADGAVVARVCVFDQGFYDQVGFGTGGYEVMLAFDPATLTVNTKPRKPRRLTADDLDLIHAARLSRRRGHGGANYPARALTEAMLHWSSDGFGLGYCDGPNGELTHHLWCNGGDAEHGPYRVEWMTYQNHEQLLELLGLLKNLSDQVDLVRMREPQGIQMQDLLARPERSRRVTRQSRFENQITAAAYWQVRICDLPGCLARTRLPGVAARFNLHVSDPVEKLLDPDAAWRGVAGDYVISLGAESAAERGHDPALSTLTASVNAFSRLWLGVRPATGLAATDDLAGPQALLEELDWALRLPEPKPDWDF